MARETEPKMSTSVQPHLTARQKEVLNLLVKGYTNSQIAETLGVSLDGAKWHMREIIATLGVDGREEAAEFWREYNGLPRRLRRFALAPLALTGLRAAPLVLGFAAVVPIVVLAIVLVANRSDDTTPTTGETPPASSPSPAPSPSPAAAAVTPVASLTATAAGEQQSARTLRAEPPTGDCDQVFRLVGDRFDVATEVEFHRWSGLDDTVLLGTGLVGHEGGVILNEVTLPDDCFPGAEYVYEARPKLGAVAIESRAVFAVDQIGTFVARQEGSGCNPVTVRIEGIGLPADINLELAWGGPDPFAHNFAELGRATVDGNGTFSLDATIPVSCDVEAVGIYAHDSSETIRVRWKAVLDLNP